MIHWQDSNLEPSALASNSGEEKDSLDHSATGHYIKPKDFQSTKEESNKTFYKCSFRATYIAESNVDITDTFSSVVAAWNAD